MGSHFIKRSVATSGVSSEQLASKLREKLNLFFTSVRIKRQLDDGLEFTAKPKEQVGLSVTNNIQYKIRDDRIDFIVNGTVGLSGTGILIVLVCFLGIVILGIVVAIYYDYISKKVVETTFEQLFTSLDFELS